MSISTGNRFLRLRGCFHFDFEEGGNFPWSCSILVKKEKRIKLWKTTFPSRGQIWEFFRFYICWCSVFVIVEEQIWDLQRVPLRRTISESYVFTWNWNFGLVYVPKHQVTSERLYGTFVCEKEEKRQNEDLLCRKLAACLLTVFEGGEIWFVCYFVPQEKYWNTPDSVKLDSLWSSCVFLPNAAADLLQKLQEDPTGL